MWILGLSVGHNGSVALIEDGRVRVAIQLERLTRRKRYPARLFEDRLDEGVGEAIHYCLRYAGIAAADIDAVAASTPHRVPDSFCWPYPPVQWIPHHRAHAEYVLHYSDLAPGLILVVDGHGSHSHDRCRFRPERVAPGASLHEGEAETVSAYHFDGAELRLVYRNEGTKDRATGVYRSSVGALWELGSAICFGTGDQAGKLMGLAGFGSQRRAGKLAWLETDGRVSTDLRPLFEPRLPYRDLAMEVQAATTDVLLELLTNLRSSVTGDVLYYSGGVALNIATNEAIHRSGLFSRINMNGSCEDNGTAIGAALALDHDSSGRRVGEPATEYLGADYDADLLWSRARLFPVRVTILGSGETTAAAAERIAEGHVIGWFQDRGEFGPRALGNRSLLADPRQECVKRLVNEKVKRRESFRPFAGSTTLQGGADYFDLEGESPLMLRQAGVTSRALPGVTHVDGTCRVHTVTPESNDSFHGLLTEFASRTGVPVVLNTSMNLPGDPIVETPDDAILLLLRSELDCLFLGNLLVVRK